MHLHQHFIVSCIMLALLYPFFGPVSLYIIVGGFLVDFDHIIYYMARFKRFNLMNIYQFFLMIGKEGNSKNYRDIIRIFHNVETILIFAILSFYSQIFLMIFFGLTVHIIMDIMYEINHFQRLENYFITLSLFSFSRK
jgi:hypothetical protein